MSNERAAFKDKFRKTTDVREILERNSFTNAITEQMWRGFQVGAAWQRSQQSTPAGYVLVPVEPTPEMYKAAKGSGVIDPRVSGYCYQLMIAAAAPKAEPEQEQYQ